MTLFLARLFKRLIILLVGAAVVYLTVWEFFPFFDNRIPAALALFVTYVFTAYIVAPGLIRVYRLFFRPTHIPLYCVTPDGFASDPINVGIVGTRVEIIKIMKQAGWYQADNKTLATAWKFITSTILKRPYPNAPFSTLYLFGRKQDFGFSLPLGTSNNRRHVRFWGCHFDEPEAFHEHVRFFKRLRTPTKRVDNRQLWVGAVSRDIGLIPIRHNAQITHRVAPDTNTERVYLIDSLKKTGHVSKTQTTKIGAPYELKNRTIGGSLKSDGTLTIATININN